MAKRSLSAGALLALALTACSGGEPDAASNAAAPEAAAPATAAAEAAPAEAAEPVEAVDAAEAPVAGESPAAAPEKVSAAAVPAAPAAPAPAEVVKVAAAPATPPASFGRCAVCHTAEKGGEDKLGPNLYGVYGKPAARGSFAFSQQFKDAGLVLDEATLHKWLENPRALVPGNRMSFPGIKDAAKRQEIIDYLKQQS
ncbi:c-type cytochrome [Erythrobacter tepidarius]|uniref:c-type cytochrome n=1 Tax=Erythrobacter tepidarius TaxID=60454 RepID=UPI001FE8D70A|nr:c-type cytochrome [Erythrobacter tepidarius]